MRIFSHNKRFRLRTVYYIRNYIHKQGYFPIKYLIYLHHSLHSLNEELNLWLLPHGSPFKINSVGYILLSLDVDLLVFEIIEVIVGKPLSSSVVKTTLSTPLRCLLEVVAGSSAGFGPSIRQRVKRNRSEPANVHIRYVH